MKIVREITLKQLDSDYILRAFEKIKTDFKISFKMKINQNNCKIYFQKLGNLMGITAIGYNYPRYSTTVQLLNHSGNIPVSAFKLLSFGKESKLPAFKESDMSEILENVIVLYEKN